MTRQVNVKPIDEQNYLKDNTLIKLLFGGLFTFDVIFTFFELATWASLLLGTAFFAIIIGIFFYGFKVFTNKVKKETSNYDIFQDEYLNHINMKGYKYAFNFAFMSLNVILAVTVFSGDLLAVFSTKDFCQLALGLICISYSLPVLYMLKDTEDE